MKTKKKTFCGCKGKKHHAKGLCSNCYLRKLKRNNLIYNKVQELRSIKWNKDNPERRKEVARESAKRCRDRKIRVLSCDPIRLISFRKKEAENTKLYSN